MTTIRQFIQTSPARANELFAKLAETSSGAVKTRERLFADLKAELELLAQLEEQHLFPVLRKHKQTKNLVAEALDDNKHSRKLLAELERTPKDDEEFLKKLGELRRGFQQHVRDEKKELLPAVLEALSDKEAEAVVEKIEDKKAEIEAARRVEADQRRAEASGEGEQTERVEPIQTTGDGAEGLERMARTAQDTLQSGLGTASQAAQRSTDQLIDLFGFSPQGESLGQASRAMEAIAETGTILARGVQDVAREWVELSQARMRKNIDGLSRLGSCRSILDVVALQSELVRDNLQQMVENSRRIAEHSVAIATEATETMSGRGRRSDHRAGRAA